MTHTIEYGFDLVLAALSSEPLCRFFILGRTNTPLSSSLMERAEQRGLVFLQWSYGALGSIFLLTSHTDIARSEEMVVIKLGFTRSSSFEPLDAQKLLEMRLVTPWGGDHESIHGNVLVACVSQREPAFCLYQNLSSTSQIYQWEGTDAILFSDTLHLLINFVYPLELNPETLPQHLLFRSLPGKMTYVKDVTKLRRGHIARFQENVLSVKQLERLDDWVSEKRIYKVSPMVIDSIDSHVEQIVGYYVQQIKQSGHELLMLLSGGIDSSLLTSYIQTHLPPQQILKSATYTIEAQEFDTEIEYSRHAIEVFGTAHRYFEVLAKDYVSLLERLTNFAVQPVDSEQDPCYLALAEGLSGGDAHYMFSGSVADTLLGYGDAKRFAQVERFRKFPYSHHILDMLGKSVSRILPNKAYGLRDTAFLLRSLKDPLSPYHPDFRESLFTNLERVLSCFSSEAISEAIKSRNAELEIYSNSQNIPERSHFHGLQIVYNEESVMTQIFRAYNLEVITPYMDSEFVRLALTIDPRIRYFAMGRAKWLPKALIEKRLSKKRQEHQITQKPKRGGGFDKELYKWMRSGILGDMVHAIERPGYLNVKEFEQVKESPDWFTWNLLTLDLFEKKVIKR